MDFAGPPSDPARPRIVLCAASEMRGMSDRGSVLCRGQDLLHCGRQAPCRQKAIRMKVVIGILQWTLAILSVGGTLALFTWIGVMLFKKDRNDDVSGNRH